MKILYVSETYEPDRGGMPTLIKNFTQGLAARGHDVRLWTRGDRPQSYEEHQGQVSIYRQRSKPYLLSRGHRVTTHCKPDLESLLSSWTPDLMHVHIFPSPLTAAAIAYANRHGIPLVITNHAMPENYRNLVTFKLPGFIEQILFQFGWRYLVSICNRANLVTTPTPTALGYLKRAGLHSPGRAISNGVDTDQYRAATKAGTVRTRFGLPSGVPTLLYLGRLDGEKMVEGIIQALPHLKSGYHLLLTGTGNGEQRLKQLTTQLGLDAHITFTGGVSNEDKLALYQYADIFVIASPAELQSLVTLEAMSCQLPVIAVAAGALTELCIDQSNGLLFHEGDSADLASKMDTLLQSASLRASYGAAGRSLVERLHSLKAAVINYENAYIELLPQTVKSSAATPPPTALSDTI